MDGTLVQRLRRMYAAIGETVETDMSKLPAFVVRNDKINFFFQDFSGGKSPEQLVNALHTVIAIIASLEYHLRRWADHNGHASGEVTRLFQGSRPLQIIHDLWINEKHGYPPRSGRGYSGEKPKLQDIHSAMQLSTQAHAGSTVVMTLGRGGVPVIGGDGSAAAVITGKVVDDNGNFIGEIDKILKQGLDDCESLMRQFNITLDRKG